MHFLSGNGSEKEVNMKKPYKHRSKEQKKAKKKAKKNAKQIEELIEALGQLATNQGEATGQHLSSEADQSAAAQAGLADGDVTEHSKQNQKALKEDISNEEKELSECGIFFRSSASEGSDSQEVFGELPPGEGQDDSVDWSDNDVPLSVLLRLDLADSIPAETTLFFSIRDGQGKALADHPDPSRMICPSKCLYEQRVKERLLYFIRAKDASTRKKALQRALEWTRAVHDTRDRVQAEVYRRVVYELKTMSDLLYSRLRKQVQHWEKNRP